MAQMSMLLLLAMCGVAPTAASGPLFVSEFLPERYLEAQHKSRVDLSSLGWNKSAPMHSGYFTLNKELGKNTFFWYMAPLDGNADAPVLLWMQGGPGASSLFGLFREIGPISIAKGGRIEERQITWNRHFHLLFLDNPVGTGFSYTDTEAGFARGYKQYGSDLYSALAEFFQLFPKLRNNDFYLTGESYGGKYVTACAYEIHKRNQNELLANKINLKGISIGDGAMDLGAQFKGFPDLLWHLGMADESERRQFQKYQDTYEQLLTKKDYIGAFEVFDEMLNGDFYPYPTYYANVTGMGSNYFNFELSPDATPLGGDFVEWLNTPKVRELIHVGNRAYAPDNSTVESHLKGDWMRSVAFMLIPIMEKYKVLIYNGQNDVIVGPTLIEGMIYNLDWSGKAAYADTKKIIWRRSDKGPGSELPDVAGYAREVGNFRQVVVRGAGHMVPGDQPERALDMIERYVAGRSFGELFTKPASPSTGGDLIV